MNASNQSDRFEGAVSLILLATISLVLLSACTAPGTGRDQLNSSGVTVVGVTAKTGLEVAINRNSLARDFAGMLAARQQFQVIPASVLRETIGSVRVDEI